MASPPRAAHVPEDVSAILHEVVDRFELGPHGIELLLGRNRRRYITRARGAAMALIRKRLDRSLTEVASYFGVDHTTVQSACRAFDNRGGEGALPAPRSTLVPSTGRANVVVATIALAVSPDGTYAAYGASGLTQQQLFENLGNIEDPKLTTVVQVQIPIPRPIRADTQP